MRPSRTCRRWLLSRKTTTSMCTSRSLICLRLIGGAAFVLCTEDRCPASPSSQNGHNDFGLVDTKRAMKSCNIYVTQVTYVTMWCSCQLVYVLRHSTSAHVVRCIAMRTKCMADRVVDAFLRSIPQAFSNPVPRITCMDSCVSCHYKVAIVR